MAKNTVTMQFNKDGKEAIVDCHPSQVENMERQGWEKAAAKPVRVSKTKPKTGGE